MPSPPELRPMVPADADAVLDLMGAAFQDLDRRLGNDPHPPPEDRAPGIRRIVHLVETDPGGAWVAPGPDGEVAGAAVALVREGLWGLSLLVVDPRRQSGGVGSALLRAALAYGDGGVRGGIILASEDARALRAYSRAGFALRPVMDAGGPVRRRPEVSPRVRPLRWPEDAPIVDAASRHVRGASHAREVPNYVDWGIDVLVHEDGGWAAGEEGRVRVLAAVDERIAADLLRAVLATTPDGKEAWVGFIDAGNDWAVRVALDAGLEMKRSGAVFVRGDVGPLAPYIPSGAYL
jgi:GNAT superfamily N-acetyltransferase